MLKITKEAEEKQHVKVKQPNCSLLSDEMKGIMFLQIWMLKGQDIKNDSSGFKK